MLLEDLECIVPNSWQPMNFINDKVKIIELTAGSVEYFDIERRIMGKYYSKINGIFKIQNPTMYARYKLKATEYGKRGPYQTRILFHDTPIHNITSISYYNLDYRCGERNMFGPGVYFSINPELANRHASRSSGLKRAMIVAEVLTQNVQVVEDDIYLPDFHYDTVLCHRNQTIVKYFDSEYYPQYYAKYISL